MPILPERLKAEAGTARNQNVIQVQMDSYNLLFKERKTMLYKNTCNFKTRLNQAGCFKQ
jgi:hypothetical protein